MEVLCKSPQDNAYKSFVSTRMPVRVVCVCVYVILQAHNHTRQKALANALCKAPNAAFSELHLIEFCFFEWLKKQLLKHFLKLLSTPCGA